MRVLSLGGGVQSSTLLLMAVHGELELDRAVFADTQDEDPETYEYLEELVPIAERAGIPVDIVTKGHLGAVVLSGTRGSIIPLYVMQPDGKAAPVMRQCTRDFKIRMVIRQVRAIRKDAPVEMVMGISLDEIQRAKVGTLTEAPWATYANPLLDCHMTRTDCERWLTERGHRIPPKSACYYCPYLSNQRWRDMRDHRPETWQRAVAFDAAVRHANPKLNGPAYLHRSLVPLDMVDLSTPRERSAAAGQVDMFEVGECTGFGCMGEAL